MKLVNLLYLLILYAFGIVAAQESCDTIVQAAVERASENCDGLRRNEACYGNIQIDAEASENTENFDFDTEGDRVNVGAVASMRLSSQLEGSMEWGISLMRLQANLPDDSSDAVSIVIFGSVQLENEASVDSLPIELDVIANANVNLRESPVDGAVIRSFQAGETAKALGRNEDGSWVLIQDTAGQLGWVSAQFLDGDNLTLVVVPVDYQPNTFTAMQAFTFESLVTDSPCETMPDSGLIIQVPEGLGLIELRINEVFINLGSTAYLKTTSETLEIYLLEGTADVTAQDSLQFMLPGTVVSVPIDGETHRANAAPAAPRPYAESDLLGLPLSLDANTEAENPIIESITPAEPVPAAEIEQQTSELYAPLGAVAGTYRFERTLREPFAGSNSSLLCPANESQSYEQFIDLSTLTYGFNNIAASEVEPSVWGDSLASHANIRPENHTPDDFTLIAQSYIIISLTTIETRVTLAQRSDLFGEQGCRQVWIGQLIQRSQ